MKAAELAARESYGRLLALLSARGLMDLSRAEDVLSDAFVRAMEVWPIDGVPEKPDAWLLSVARRRSVDMFRRSRANDRALVQVAQEPTDDSAVFVELTRQESEVWPDERLKLLFVCTHPAIDVKIRAPLMLQTVLGLSAEKIGAAFRVAPKSIGQALWRAKQKIKLAGIPFEEPQREALAARLGAVLEAIYCAYGAGWEALAVDPEVKGLAEESLHLAKMLTKQLPDEPEVYGLLAFMQYAESRREARRDEHGAFVPLERQDPALWSDMLIAAAEENLRRASSYRRPGPYQLEAAIQSVHADRKRVGHVNQLALMGLYDLLETVLPSTGVRVARISVIAEVRGATAALEALTALAKDTDLRDYQPHWALKAELHRRLEESTKADAAYRRAAGLTEDPAIRDYLLSCVRGA